MKPMIVAPYSGLVFWLLQMLFASAHSIFRWVSFLPGARNAFMIAGSAFVILLTQHERSGYFLLFFLIALSTSVYHAGKKISSSSSSYTKNNFYFFIIAIIIFFLFYYKYVFFQNFINYILFSIIDYIIHIQYNSQRHIFLIGVSYLSFKFISFIIDSYNDKIKKYDYITFINYILFFPNFFCGPINRYQNFVDDIHNIDNIILLPNVSIDIGRIINGLFKKTIANALIPFSIISIDLSSASVTQVDAIVSIYVYMLYIYLDFSGYSDMAIGSAKLVGIHLPENFDWPFFRRNLQQFWAHWHMSLSAWLMDYIYWPLARKGRRIEVLRRKPVTNSNICIVVTFVVCGLWHGESINFLIWGTYHGIGLALLNVYSQWEKKYAPIAWRKFMNTSRIAYICSSVITIQYVAFGFLLFACDIDRLKQFLSLFL
jgi:D-alanyl-lipoteichoic acid acyltransferase DltB (MBOAT superfamily)